MSKLEGQGEQGARSVLKNSPNFTNHNTLRRKSDKIQEQTISNVKQKFQNLRFIETRVSEGKSAVERPHSLFIQTCT